MGVVWTPVDCVHAGKCWRTSPPVALMLTKLTEGFEVSIKSLQATRDGRSSSASRFMSRVGGGSFYIMPSDRFQERVVQAAEAALKRQGSVGPLDLFQEMRLLHPIQLENWRKGNEHYHALQPWIQVGPDKLQKAIDYFRQWVRERGLCPIEAAYTRRGPRGIEQLRVTEDGDPELEKFYRSFGELARHL